MEPSLNGLITASNAVSAQTDPLAVVKRSGGTYLIAYGAREAATLPVRLNLVPVSTIAFLTTSNNSAASEDVAGIVISSVKVLSSAGLATINLSPGISNRVRVPSLFTLIDLIEHRFHRGGSLNTVLTLA